MRLSSLLTFLLLMMLAACAAQDSPRRPSTNRTADVEAWSGAPPIAAPWLREQLPDGVMAYVRIPHPLGILAMPKGNVLDTALGSEANITNLLAVQQGLAQLLTDSVGPELGPAAQLLTGKLRSPIEVSGAAMPAPWVIVALTLDIHSNAELESLLNQIAQTTPLPPLQGAIDAEGFARMQAGIPVWLHFDAVTGRLAMYGGLNAERAAFAALLDARDSAAGRSMQALEAEIDSSGQGYFAWADTTLALGMAPLLLPADAQQMIRASGVDQIRALAMGAGVANGKGRMKLVADVGTDRARRPLPVVDNRISATSVGDPDSVFLLSIPSPEEFARLERLALSYLPPDAATGWNNVKLALVDRIGVSIEEILGAVGPELITFADAAGNFSGLKVRDAALLDDVLARLAASAGTPIEQRNVAGATIRHISLPGSLGMPGVAEAGEAAALVAAITRMRNRMYWIEDGDYLYLAGLPQLLMDRARLGADTSIANWLRDDQRVDLSSAMFGMTGRVDRLPRMTYQIYVSMMQSLADLVDADFDVWSMPTPAQLGLPDEGTLGLAVNLGEPQLSLELTYESHPAEVLFAGGGAAGIAAAGVLAAIAIPAYQDYTARAQVSEGLALAAVARTAVAETWSATGELPADRAAAGLGGLQDPDAIGLSGRFVDSIVIDNGAVVIRYGNAAHARLSGRVLELTPFLSVTGAITWVCGYASPPPDATTLGARWPNSTSVGIRDLPANCRPGAPARMPALAPSSVPQARLF